jgi:pantoate--beta-alanine ligase
VKLLDTKAHLRAACDQARSAGRRVGLVPTMGYFHEGHYSLMRRARAETDFVVVTLFVNPTQFGAGEDLDAYPRDPERDRSGAEAEGVDALFAPEMYDADAATTVHVDGLTDIMCGVARPTHFDGVTTVVAKLFAVAGPCTAYFGRKDAQQLAVVRRMTADLDLPVSVVGCEIVREADGLALSSRNAYLEPAEREAAPVLARALSAVPESTEPGSPAEDVRDLVRRIVGEEPLVELEYVEVRDPDSLAPVESMAGDVLVAVAARVGRARLIDNVTISFAAGDVTAADRSP